MHFTFSLLLLFLATFPLLAQTKTTVTDSPEFTERRGLQLRAGMTYGFLQDLRYSPLAFSGRGQLYGLSFVKFTAERDRSFDIDVTVDKMTGGPENVARVKGITTAFTYAQQRRVGQLIGADWFAGGELRAAGTLYFSDAGGNNGQRPYTDVALAALSSLRFNLNGQPLTVGGGLGLLHWVQDGHSFAFAYPEHVLNGPGYSYEDAGPGSIFGRRKLTSLHELVQLRTFVHYRPGKRIGLHYRWDLTRYAEVKGYPVTQGQHQFLVSYTF